MVLCIWFLFGKIFKKVNFSVFGGFMVKGVVKWVFGEEFQFIGRMEDDKCFVILGDGGISLMKFFFLSVVGCMVYDVVMIF